jgi:lysophospholipase L1-like esterase
MSPNPNMRRNLLPGVMVLSLAASLFAAENGPSGQWEADIQAFEAADKANPPPEGAVLFVGASGIRLWKTLPQDFPEHQVINRGFGGSQIADSVQYADRIVIPYKPRLIVFYAGGNDINAGKLPEGVFEDFKAFVAKVRAKLPDVRIAFMSSGPSIARWAQADKQRKLNQLVKEYVGQGDNLDYIDAYDAFLGADGKPRPELYVADKLHNNADGYKIRAELVRPHLEKFKTSSKPGNPVFPGWYADPEGAVFGARYWIFPTYSAPFGQQTFFDAFSSPDLVEWTKHPRILDTNIVTWAKRAMWAPAIIENGGRYFFFFSANNIQNDQQIGGIGIAVADKPEGPYTDYLGKPLVDRIYNGAQPIDQFVFRDQDGRHYLIYGGWGHCNVARLKPDFRGLEPYPDGALFKEITPEGYVEGPFMFLRSGKYYFMWSEGNWTGPNYCVAYAMADSPMGPFKRIAKILQQDPKVGTGAGHHSVIKIPGEDSYFIVYHRRPLSERDGNHRVTCIDRMEFDAQGLIKPVKITFEGVKRHPLK